MYLISPLLFLINQPKMGKLNISTYACLLRCMVIVYFSSCIVATKVFDIVTFGAKSDGLNDSSSAFLSAWIVACNTTGFTMILIPKGRYLLRPVDFQGGDCLSNDITFRVDGTVVAPLDYLVLGGVPRWIGFEGANGVSIVGSGYLDARGTGLWACKQAGASSMCPDGATTLTFTNSNNIVIKGITSLNSQLYHIVINKCKNVHVEGVQIRATGSSPNTDGIHVQQSMDVTILKSVIKTGDDCVSIGPGTKNLWIERVACGPGHGISIGSLAKDVDEEGVLNVTVKTVVLTHTTNGLRIKSWGRPSEGFVRGVVFEDVLMRHVKNPIIIDQNYCPNNDSCPGQESGVSISEVEYRKIRGTSTSEVAMKFECSPSTPCTQLTLHNVNLTYIEGVAKSHCSNAAGNVIGLVHPTSCF